MAEALSRAESGKKVAHAQMISEGKRTHPTFKLRGWLEAGEARCKPVPLERSVRHSASGERCDDVKNAPDNEEYLRALRVGF